jgi:hypothetical protein
MHETVFLCALLLLVVIKILARKILAGFEGHDLPTMLNDN